MSGDILFEVAEKVATITLNRPERRNAFTLAMIDEWVSCLEECRARADIHTVLITGAGKAFCSGGDIDELMKQGQARTPQERKDELVGHVHRIPLTLDRMDKPVIVAINGAATGAGLDLALMCDLRYAASSARFAENYVKMALMPGAGGAFVLPRIVGRARALEMLWTGDFIDSEEAERIGLINKALPDEELMAHAHAMARRLADGPVQSIRSIKRAVRAGQNSDLATSLDYGALNYGVLASGEDHHEAVDAFLEKRAPDFKGGGS
ncbi:MAG: enoyl-CoA hydratase [Rhodospirillaceae bacterium]|nr:enoyl-CoA hydratase [Rhodospirillaceae bacterium]